MSDDCREFVTEKYSIEATYGKLSKYYEERGVRGKEKRKTLAAKNAKMR